MTAVPQFLLTVYSRSAQGFEVLVRALMSVTRRRSDPRSLLTSGRRSGSRSDQAKRLPLVAGVFRRCWLQVVRVLFPPILAPSTQQSSGHEVTARRSSRL